MLILNLIKDNPYPIRHALWSNTMKEKEKEKEL